MRKRLTAMLLVVCMLFTFMPTAAFAEDGEMPPVTYGEYVDDVWTPSSGDGTKTDEGTGITVSKTATPTDNQNEYEITLQVVTSTETTVTTASAATVLVIDVSGSMGWCAECGGEEWHKQGCKYYNNWWENDVRTAQNRLTAAKNAAKDFLESYAGETAGTGRYLAIVKFSTNASIALDWVDVSGGSGETGYKNAVAAINGLGANGGTNLDDGLRKAKSRFDKSAINSVPEENRNVIALTDGVPTYYIKDNGDRGGGGDEGSAATNNATAVSAAALREKASVYTVCFGVANQTCYTGGPTVGDFLKDSIASSTDKAYNADNTDDLNEAFESITDSITSGISGAGITVTDPMGDGVTMDEDSVSDESAIEGDEDGFVWTLDPANAETSTEGGVTTYTYTLTYTITLDTDYAAFDESAYYPANGETYLTIPSEPDDIRIDFPVPGITGVKPSYTVTYDRGARGALVGQDANGQVVCDPVKIGEQTPAAPGVTPDSGYYFTGWDPEIADTVTENVTYTAQYAEQAPITITGNSDQKTYDGMVQTVDGFTAEGLPNGYSIEGLTYSASGTNVGTYAGVFTGTVQILDENSVDVTVQFAISQVPGQLEIQQRPITIQAESDSKIFDGTPLTNDGYSIIAGELASGDRIVSVTVTGSQTEAGSSANTPSGAVIKDGETVVTGNYLITYTPGTLTVNKDNNASIEAVGYTGTYDGAGHDAVTEITLKNGKGAVLNNADWTITYQYNGETYTSMPQFKDAGTYPVTIIAKNDNYNTVTITVNAVIAKKNVTMTSADGRKTYDGTPLTNSTVTADGFVSGEGASYTVTGSQTIAGNSKNTFTYTLNSNTKAENYNITQVEGTLTVDPITTQIFITANSNEKVYDGTALTDSGYTYTNGILVEGDTLTAVVAGSITDAGTADNKVISYQVKRGAVDVTASYTFGTPVDGKLTVKPRAVTMISSSATKTFDGTPLTNNTVTANGFVSGEGASYTVTGSQTIAGTSDNTFTYVLNSGTKAQNYTITPKYGTLSVTPSDQANLNVTGYTGVYDGEEHTVTTTVSGAVEGTEWTYEYSVDGGDFSTEKPMFTDVGKHTVTVRISNSNYVTKTGSAEVEITKRPVTLTSDSASRPYNGLELKAENVTVSGQGFVKDEGATYSNYASITDFGTIDNTFDYSLTGGAKASNYDITVVYGTLEITRYTEQLTITAASASKVYDGTPLMNNGYSANANVLVTGDVLQDVVVEGSQTDVGTGVNQVTSYKIMRNGVDVTNNYSDAVLVDGTLTVTPRKVTLTSATDSKVYDGTPLTNNTVTANGFVTGEGATYDVTGSQIEAGSSENTFAYELKADTKAANYAIETVAGTLTVTPYTGTITIIANSDTKTYDGTPLTNNGFTVVGDLMNGDKAEAVVEGTITDAGSAANVVTSYKIMHGQTDVTNSYNGIVPQNGLLKVEPKAVTLTSATDSKTYDSKPLTNDKVTAEGFVTGEGATYTVSGSQTEAGSSKNTFTYTLKDNTKAQNYTITSVEGTLTVFPVETLTVTIKGNSAAADYDGTEKKASGYTVVSISNPLYKASDITFTGSAEAKGTEPGVYTMGLKQEQFANNNKNFENVTFIVEDGALTINPQVTVEYYLESVDPANKIASVDNGQPNPFHVAYGSGWNVAIGSGEDSNYVAPKNITVGEKNYVFDFSNELSAEKAETNAVVKLVYTLDEIGEGTDEETEVPDDIPDKYQVTVKYTAETGGKITGIEKAVITLKDDASGKYLTQGDVTAPGSKVERTSSKYRFDEWTGNWTTKSLGDDEELAQFTIKDAKGGETYIVTAEFNKKSSGQTIKEPEVPQGLNGDDHFQYIFGYDDGTVRPLAKITRAEVAAIFYRLLDDETREYYFTTENDFPDMKDTMWYNKAVSTLANAGIITGCSDGLFHGGRNITRAELATIIAKFDNITYRGKDLFSDISGHWARAYINSSADKGWIVGDGTGKFRPYDDITRAEVMTMINAVLNRAVDEDGLCAGYKKWPDNTKGTWYYYQVIEATNYHDYEREADMTETWLEILPDKIWDEAGR